MTNKSRRPGPDTKARQPSAALPPTIAALASSIPAPYATSEAVMFETEEGSPFADGYSLAKEHAALSDLIQADDPDEGDPRYPRLVLYEERLRAFERMEEEYKLRAGAEKVVTVQEAIGLRSLGTLVDEEQDTMTLHTKEAYRLFMGRARDPNGQYAQIVGGKRVAAALKSLWILSGNDNPYADWALLRHEELMQEFGRLIEQEVKRLNQKLDAQRVRGLSYSILKSAEPKVNALGFKSPYGYAISNLVVQYDYYIRVVKTLVRKDQLTDDQGRTSIRDITRRIRAGFIETARFERFLLRPELRDLSRADFLPGVPEQAGKRVQAVQELFGPIPSDIYSGKHQPRHSRRRLKLGPQERALLEHVSAELQRAEMLAADASGEAQLL